MTQAVAFDMDDTLLRDDRTISPYTIQVLRCAHAQGIHVIPASGRARDSMRPFVEQLGCASCYIACNGAELWSSNHQLLHRETLDVALIHEIAAFAAAHQCYAQVYYGAKFYYSMHCVYADQYAASSMLEGEYVGDLTQYVKEPTTKVLMMDTPEKIASMTMQAQTLFHGRAQVTCSKPYFLEVNPLNATKGLALERASRLLHFSMANAIAFGDSLNDVSMLQAAGTGVAMQNARADVLSLIPVHCMSNMADGVAHYIEEHCLQEERT